MNDNTQPTIVLVHGGFADGTGWSGVVRRLQGIGHRVIAPANPLRGLGTDADYIRDLLKSIDGDIVLVGHSYGGAVISAAAQGIPNVKALVYIAAFILDGDESPGAILNRFPGSKMSPAILDAVQYTGGTDLYIKAEHFADVFAGDLPGDTIAEMAAVQRPFAAVALEETLRGKGAWHDVPAWALIATEDHAIPPTAGRFMAERASATTVEVPGSHAVFASRPDDVTGIILKAVDSLG